MAQPKSAVQQTEKLNLRQPFTLNKLDPQDNGEQRWSVGKNGPRAYLTCDRETAEMICKGLNLVELMR